MKQTLASQKDISSISREAIQCRESPVLEKNATIQRVFSGNLPFEEAQYYFQKFNF
jgi:hypothetical protein